MRAIVCEEYGGPEKLVLREIDPPELGPGQVRLRVEAAAVTFVDLLMPQGKYQVKPDVPFTPGSHGAGEVLEVAGDVTSVKPGDRIYGYAPWGALAEEMAVDAACTFALPANVETKIGAAYGNGYGTSLHALRDRGQLQPGETLLVHGAAGGVGLAAVDIGRAMGARVIATAAGPEKAAVIKEYGAEAVIDYTQGPFKDAGKELTGGRGADVIYDPVGGEVFDQSLHCINWGGRLLVVGFAGGTIPKAPANLPLLKGAAIVGVSLGGFRLQDPDGYRALHETLLEMIGAGRLEPRIAAAFPLENTADALIAMTKRQTIGRVVVTMNG
ncbi:MAG: NADPH:quinone oxidoreductase family protein [Magnetovibrio sp.]|nr:NADPH:quinone oxidoreductase family protein [Magnetovibrio sp.]